MRLLVCGGRRFNDQAAVFAVLDRIHRKRPIQTLIHGAAPGADSLANTWAEWHAVRREPYPYPKGHGRAGGPIRNQRMIDEGRPDGVVAFPGGAGTADMVRRAEKAGLTVWKPIAALPER